MSIEGVHGPGVHVLYFPEKWGVVLVFQGVEMVRLDGLKSPSRAVLCLQKGGELAHILRPI